MTAFAQSAPNAPSPLLTATVMLNLDHNAASTVLHPNLTPFLPLFRATSWTLTMTPAPYCTPSTASRASACLPTCSPH